MLLDGLHSCEVLQRQLEDLSFSEGHLSVLGKGNKKRVVPLPAEIIEVLQNYLRCERPLTNSPLLFACWKGRRRGFPMTAAGTALAVSSSSSLEQDPPSQPPPFSTHLRIRYGACRHFLVRSDSLAVRSRSSLVHGIQLEISEAAPTFVAGLGRQRPYSTAQLDSPRRFPASLPLSA